MQRKLKNRGQDFNSLTVKLAVFPFFLFLFCLTSCAGIFNKPTHWLTIRTNLAADSVKVGGMNIRFKEGEARLKITRDQKPLVISLPEKDSVHTVQIRSRNSANYILGV